MDSKVQDANFMEEICSIPVGESIRLCIQCGTCSASCPNANLMNYTPREIIALIRAGMWEEVLSSNSMWLCLSCYLCTVRCPRGIKPTDLMHALESLAFRHRFSSRQTLTPIMYKTFSNYVYGTGSLPEARFMARFYLLTKKPLRTIKMIPIALSLFKHGRLSMKVRRLNPKAKHQLKAILDRAEALGGAS